MSGKSDNNMIISQMELNKIVSNEQIIKDNIDVDPLKLAFKGVDAAICNQIKYLQRAKGKLPSYYNAQCIIPSLSYEQSSSEATASSKDFGCGKVAIDLTCGLGVDTLYLSNRFQKIISIERDEVLCKIATINFQKLGKQNIEVRHHTAENFLRENSNMRVDLIYIDPARRDQTKKVFLIEDCSPDMSKIMPLACKISLKIAVKLSPMFDVDAAYKFFSQFGNSTIETLSLNGECKEVVVIIDNSDNKNSQIMIDNSDNPTQNYSPNRAVVVKGIDNYNRYSFNFTKELVTLGKYDENYSYLYIPDVVFYKNRSVTQLMVDFYKCSNFYMHNHTSPVMSNLKISNFEGESYKIEKIYPYKPKELKRLFKNFGSKAKILKKDFPYTTAQIKKELSIKDSDKPIVMFTNKSAIFLTHFADNL